MPHNTESDIIMQQKEVLITHLKEEYNYLDVASWCLSLGYIPLLSYVLILMSPFDEVNVSENDLQTLQAEETVETVWRACVLEPSASRRKALFDRVIDCVSDPDKEMYIYADYYER